MDPQQQPINNEQPNTPQAPLTPNEPPKSKKIMLIVGVIILAVIVLGVIIFALSSNKGDTSKDSSSPSTSTNQSANQTSDKYQKYSVTDKLNGITFSVSFYKDARVEEKNGRTYLNSGEA